MSILTEPKETSKPTVTYLFRESEAFHSGAPSGHASYLAYTQG
jgi:hypothetical protein